MDSETRVTDVVVLKQLPVIEERLAVLHDEITAQVSSALAMECTEDNVKEIKKVRANLKKDATDFETRRKDIKKKILEPYERFEDVYKKYIGNLYKEADMELGARINEVETSLKNGRKEEILGYFEECTAAYGLTEEDISFDDLGVNVTLSASMKSMKDSVKQGVERIAGELTAIAQDPNAEEVLVEYRKTKNLSAALLAVSERHRQMEEIRRRAEETEAAREAEAEKAAEIDALIEEQKNEDVFSAPTVEAEENVKEESEEIYEIVFRVRGGLSELAALKRYLVNSGINYEQIQIDER